MARGASQSQTTATSSTTNHPGLMAPRGSAATVVGMRRRRLARSGGNTSSAAIRGGSEAGSNMLRLYIDDASSLKISPAMVLVMSLCFISFVTTLNVFGKLYCYKSNSV